MTHDSRLIWRRPEWPDAPRGMFCANVPKGMVEDPATGRASSRVYRWPIARPLGDVVGLRASEVVRLRARVAYMVALGVVAGPHPGSLFYAGSLQAAVDVAEALVEERPLPAPTDEEIEGDEPSDGPTPEVVSLGDMLAASLAKLIEDSHD